HRAVRFQNLRALLISEWDHLPVAQHGFAAFQHNLRRAFREDAIHTIWQAVDSAHALANRVKRNLIDARILFLKRYSPELRLGRSDDQRAFGWVADHSVGAVDICGVAFRLQPRVAG